MAKLKQLDTAGESLGQFSGLVGGRRLSIMVDGCTSAGYLVEAFVPQTLVLDLYCEHMLQ